MLAVPHAPAMQTELLSAALSLFRTAPRRACCAHLWAALPRLRRGSWWLYALQGEPPQQLRDFAKVRLKAGSSATVQLKISERDRSVWGDDGAWSAVSGSFGVTIGQSSRDPNAVNASFTV